MRVPKTRRAGFAASFPPALQAMLDDHAQRLAAALIDATGPHAARVTLPPATCSNRADGAVTWSIVQTVHLVLPDRPHGAPPTAGSVPGPCPPSPEEAPPMPSPAADGQRRRAPAGTPPPRVPKPPIDEAARRGAIAKIHIARQQLGMGDDAYRDMLERITGVRSAGALSARHLDDVLQEMKRLGFKALPASRVTSHKAQIRMIFAVWKDLQPHLEDGSEAALRAFCARQTKSPKHPGGVSAPQFLGPTEATKVLEGLKAWLARVRTRARLAAEARSEGMGQ